MFHSFHIQTVTMYRNTDFKLVFFGRKQLQHIFPFSVADALSWCSFNSAINLHALFLFQHFVKITGGTRLWDLAAESGLELYPADLTCSLSGATLVLHRLKCVHRLIINQFFFFFVNSDRSLVVTITWRVCKNCSYSALWDQSFYPLIAAQGLLCVF